MWDLLKQHCHESWCDFPIAVGEWFWNSFSGIYSLVIGLAFLLCVWHLIWTVCRFVSEAVHDKFLSHERKRTIDEWLTKPPIIDHLFSDKVAAVTTQTKITRYSIAKTLRKLTQWYGPSAWQPDAFNRALLISLVYPLVFLLVMWGFTGVGQIGGVSVLPMLNDLLRWAILLATALWSIGLWLIMSHYQRMERLLQNRQDKWGKLRELCLLLALFAYSLLPLITLFFLEINADTSAVAFAGAVAGLALIYDKIMRPAATHVAGFKRTLAGACLLLALCAVLSTMPVWTAEWFTQHVRKDAWLVSKKSFILLVFFGIFPVLNALCDYVSVGVTRVCLVGVIKRNMRWGWYWFIDVAAALVLTIVLFGLVISTLHAMEWLKWGVNASHVWRSFIDNPIKGEANWITLMALTNVVPTLLHMGYTLYALSRGGLRNRARHIEAFRTIHRIQALVAQKNTTDTISYGAAKRLYNFLHVDTVFSAVAALLTCLLITSGFGLMVWETLVFLTPQTVTQP